MQGNGEVLQVWDWVTVWYGDVVESGIIYTWSPIASSLFGTM